MPSNLKLKAKIALFETRHRLGLSRPEPRSTDPDPELSEGAANRGLTREAIEQMVAAHPRWWHRITLPFGLKTPGRISEDVQDWTAQAIPDDLSGKSVLDIGAWDGYYSFLAERRGAAVTAIDLSSNPHGIAGFDVARRVLGSNAEHQVLEVESVDTLGRSFDVVFFFGVYYHLKNPFLVFEKLARITRSTLILEGHYLAGGRKPLMRFYPGGELRGDKSNWWAANERCLVSMLEAAGFSKVACVDQLWGVGDSGRILIRAEK